ncbi:hypothetical protein K437DRAFT_267750 [Tilletiaria anomala UBC 951]|uniref:Membrane insertase YidC/Oxa/ALB C-terminal domain-containing protein n=1 Tax=Tilletiaria anomala (strain ATCC 24038 / CBS 436.72 / UBC 951) TaxID=1037660 RepID=A0A066W1Z9_TILAU|nr:uncharacterized protein K437DRAFT_267750 [Tilletiaria anomala UBC 951]KDN47982.1 hypothetical protein K437DRAFT_267750 [Tilletiaria anomala UBC 951]
MSATAIRLQLRAGQATQWRGPTATSSAPLVRSSISATLRPRAHASCSYSTATVRAFQHDRTPKRPRIELGTVGGVAVPPLLALQRQRLLTGAGSSRSLSLWPISNNKESQEVQETVPGAASNAQEKGTEALAEVKEQLGSVRESGTETVNQAQQAVADAVVTVSETLDAASNSSAEAASLLANYANEFEAAGLPTGWPPVPWVQHFLEYVTQTVGLPWWATIIGMTCVLRLTVAPLVVKVQANNIRLANIQPQMQLLMKDIEYAKNSGDMVEMQQAAAKVQKLMRDNDASPFKSFMVPLLQMPIFLVMFFAIRGMASGGLASMQNGGFGWITDLTMPDPYVALPILSSMATLLVVETGAEGGAAATANNPQQRMVRNVFRVVLVAMPYFVMSFPAALHLVWTTSSIFSLAQFGVLRTQWAKRKFNLPKKVNHPAPTIDAKSGGFLDGVRQGMNFGQAANQNPYAQYGRTPSRSRARSTSSPGHAAQSTTSREHALRNLVSGGGVSESNSVGAPAQATHASQEGGQDSLRAQKEAAKQKRVQASRERRAIRRRI